MTETVSRQASLTMAQRLQMLQATLLETLRSIRQHCQAAVRLAGLESLASWCQKALVEFHSCIREFVHGVLHYQAAMEKVKHLEKQVQQLVAEKEALHRSLGKPQQSPEHPPALCKVCSKWISANGQSVADMTQILTCGPSADFARVPAQPPLPPPPPPPPPLPPPPLPVFIGRRFKLSKNFEEADHLTLKKQGYPIVKLADLQRTTLRKTMSAVVIRDKENMLPISLEDVTLQKQHLKKTSVKRSPGGTPMHDRKRRRESGQGLTPMMTRALRLRFQGKTLSRSSSSETSPASSPDFSKSASPGADSSF